MPNEAKPTDDAAPAPITREEFEKLAAHAGMLTANLRKEREAAAKEHAAMEERFAALTSRLEQFAPTPQTQATPDAGAKYEAKLREMEAKLQAADAAREAEKAKAMQQEERTALSQALTARGVTGAQLKMATALLYTEEKRIARDEHGNIGVKVQRAGYDEIVPLDAALDEWLKTDEGKTVLPSRGVAGSGTVPGRPAHRGPMTPEEKRREAMQALIPAWTRSHNT